MPTIGIKRTDYPHFFFSPDARTVPHEHLRMPTLRAIHPAFESLGVPLGNPLRYDLYHSFNWILLTRKPWVLSYECELPRGFSPSARRINAWARERLLHPTLARLMPFSNFARTVFCQQNADWRGLSDALAKTTVVYPSLAARPVRPRTTESLPLTLTFIGSQFARKGGIATLLCADRCRREGLNVRFNLVSRLQVGRPIYTDLDSDFYASYWKLLENPHVTLHRGLPNAEVLNLLDRSDFALLPTLDDSFGFSLIEALASAVPSIATAVCAIPEVIDDGENGHLLTLPVDSLNRWSRLFQNADARYPQWLRDTFQDLADQLFRKIVHALDEPADRRQAMRDACRKKHAARFEKLAASAQLAEIYQRAVSSKL